jgi:hypothetical protein
VSAGLRAGLTEVITHSPRTALDELEGNRCAGLEILQQ